MATSTPTRTKNVPRLAVFASRASSGQFSYEEQPSGARLYRDVPIFRAGTFRDSYGIQHTFTREHLAQMIFHFGMLRDSGVFPNVPVRANHGRDVNSVIGYFTELRQEGDLLLADLEITEPAAFEKLDRTTYRARSAEVGVYETNDEAMYWPVMQGVAFVDIPAVEGLFAGDQPVSCFSLVADPVLGEGSQVQLASQVNGSTHGVIEAVEGDNATVRVFAADGDEFEPTETTVVRPLAEFTAASFTVKEPQTMHTFQVNGAPVTDFAAVQAHITSLEQSNAQLTTERTELAARLEVLETAAVEAGQQARRDFVASLAQDNKILATQVGDDNTGFTAMVLGMSDEQFAQFRETYAAAPAAPLLGQHGAPNAGGQGDPATSLNEFEKAAAIVEELKRSGLSPDQLAKTPSFQKLQALKNKGN